MRRHLHRARRAFFAATAVTALVALTGCDLQEDADIDNGRALFTENCGTCHALAEAGAQANVGPDLDAAFAESRANGMDQDTIEGVVQRQIEHPRPASPEDTAIYMPANLVEGEDAEDVAAYVARYAGVPGIEPPSVSEFFVGSCGGCHTFDPAGTAGQIGPNLTETLQGQSPAQIRESIVNPSAQIVPGFQNQMPSFATLPPDQLDALIQFLQGTMGAEGQGSGGAGQSGGGAQGGGGQGGAQSGGQSG